VSSFYPQFTIWRVCIGLDSAPRYFIAWIYYKRYYAAKTQHLKYPAAYSVFIKLAMLIHIFELNSLLTLTYISSLEIPALHALSFISFLANSTVYMTLTIATYYWPRESPFVGLSKREQVSKRAKMLTFLFYIITSAGSGYFFYRHNRYCEPYVYSLFSLCEYLTVFGNIYYHSRVIYDLDLNGQNYKLAMLEMGNSAV
jgi:hypothetical protein